MVTWTLVLFLACFFWVAEGAVYLSTDKLGDSELYRPVEENSVDTNALNRETYSDRKMLYCRNAGYIALYVDDFKVNDGVCDYDVCCDGSDEYLSGNCENKCEAVNEQYEQFRAFVSANVTIGLRKKSQLVEKSTRKRGDQESLLQVRKEKLKNNRNELEHLNGLLNKISENDHQDISAHKIRKQIQDLRGQILEESTMISLIEEDLSQNYGEKDILRAFKNLKIKKRIHGSIFYLNLLQNIYKNDTLIGNYKEVRGRYLIYENGNKCWNGPRRLSKIEMVCASEHKLMSEKEYQRCMYHLKVGTPVACDENSENALLKKFKVNYSLL